MKRVAALMCAIMIMICGTGTLSFAADSDGSDGAAGTSGALKLESSNPKDGATGTSADNLSVKLEFNEDVYDTDNEIANNKSITMVSEKGEKVPLRIVYNPKNKKQVLAVADTTSDDSYKIEQNTEYTLTVGADFQSASGDTIGTDQVVAFKTIDQKRTMGVNMGMMAVMMAGIMFYTFRSAKKQAEGAGGSDKKATPEKKVNPYKVAKETGKSVEEVIAQTAKDNEKRAAKAEREAEKEAQYEAKIEAQVAKKAGKRKGGKSASKPKTEVKGLTESGNRRVSRPRPVSEGGSTYKTGRKAEAEERARKAAEQKAKGTTNPKGKKGKKKGKKKK